ncbi:MAG: hypothetical protein F4237_12540 [Gemmatimonadetes bacterium]|nr:hypothetical protein [Gemmatimonadota bacterium]
MEVVVIIVIALAILGAVFALGSLPAWLYGQGPRRGALLCFGFIGLLVWPLWIVGIAMALIWMGETTS